jgi:hypothetical protein
VALGLLVLARCATGGLAPQPIVADPLASGFHRG